MQERELDVSKPLIMITGQTDAADGVYGVRNRWADWLADGDAITFIAPPLAEGADVDRLLDVVDGVMVPGGADVSPELYGETQLDTSRPLAPLRDRFESQVIRRAVERDIPLLCICRGFQLLNVVFGGTLAQRLDDDPDLIEHCQSEPYDIPAHALKVLEGTLLGQAMGAHLHMVNSTHDQGVNRLAPNLNVSALAEDGLVEALELEGKRFCLGVQWHPELMPENEGSKALRQSFLNACREPKESYR